MREAVVIAVCDGKRCAETWSTSPDAPPVQITMPDGSKFELDLCESHRARFVADWLDRGRPAYTRPTAVKQPSDSAAPKKARRKRRGVEARLSKKPAKDREKVPCPITGCSSYGTTPSSLSTHLRLVHSQLSPEVAASMVSELFGTRLTKRVSCPECSESQSPQYLSRHRARKHGVVA